MTRIICRLTAKNRDQLRNPTLGNRVWATFTFFYLTRYRAARRSAALVAWQCLGQVGETDGRTDGRIAASLNALPP